MAATATWTPEQTWTATVLKHDLVEAKLTIPTTARELIRRPRVLELLESAADRRIISVLAPPGYGKTAALAQWANSGRSAVAWLTADDADNDATVLFTYLTAAAGRIMPIDPVLLDSIRSAKRSIRGVVGRVLGALGNFHARLTIVIDDGQHLTDRVTLDALAEFISYLPDRAQVAILSREPIDLPFARWRMQATLLEVGPAELAMDEHEAGELVRAMGLNMAPDELRHLTRTTEGWPALLALASASGLRSGSTATDVSSRDLAIADYLRSEVVELRSDSETLFLTHTSILERLTGPVCDAVVGGHGSAEMLADLARSTLLVDEYGGSYRYHSLLREFLVGLLRAREPGLDRRLHRRAAQWYETSGDIDLAVRHAFATGDLDLAARLVGTGFVRYHWSARRATTRAWLNRFGSDALAERPWLAVLGAWEELGSGNWAEAQRLAAIAERGSFGDRPPDGTASFESGRAILRAIMCRSGEPGMLANAELAVRLECDSDTPWQDFALWNLALVRQATGTYAAADSALSVGIAAARAASNDGLACCMLGHRALLAMDALDWDAASNYLAESRLRNAAAQVDGYLSSIFAVIARARLAIHHGQVEMARAELAKAVALRAILTGAAPGLAVVALLALARAQLALGEAAGARAALAQADEILLPRSDLPTLHSQVATAYATLAALPVGTTGASALTAAELRVLALLPYYLSFTEIGERLGVRATTIRTHAQSIYGKLGASKRGEAVELAVSAGLLDPFLT